MSKQVNRRNFLRMAAGLTAGAMLAACQPKTIVVKETVVVEVEKEKVVTATPEPALDDPSAKWILPAPIHPPKRYDPVLTITQNFDQNQGIQFLEGEDIGDNVISRYLKEVMGVYYEPRWACKGPETCPQAWATHMASGELPDFFQYLYGVYLGKLLEADMLEDITDYWEALASPLTKKNKQWPDGVIWRPVTKNGRIYGLPFTNGGVCAHEMLTWVRQDWLDKLGLGLPGTLDEVYEVGKAFVKEGLARMGMSASGQEGVGTWQSSLDPIFGAFGVMPKYWLKDGKGGLIYGSLLPDNKKGLEVLQKWFKDGVIDPEFMAKGAAKAAENMAGNNAGMFFGPPWSITWPIPDSKQNDPTAEWVYDKVPAGPDGTRGRAAFKLAGMTSAFLKGVDPSKIEAVINHLNWIYARQDASPVQKHVAFEGYDYVVGDDGELGSPSVHDGTLYYEGGAGYPTWWYANMNLDTNQKLDKLVAKGAENLNPYERFLVRDPTQSVYRKAYASMYETKDLAIKDEYLGPPTPTQTEQGAFLSKLENGVYIEIITGQRPVGDHDQFVKDWLKNGGEQITKEVNDWYASL